MKRQNKLWLFLLIGAFMLILTACGNGDQATDQQENKEATEQHDNATGVDQTNEDNETATLPTIRVGMVCGGMTPLLAQIGINDGSFAEAGVNAEKVCFSSGSDAVQALVGGSIDVNLGSYEHVLKLVKNDLGVKAYGEFQNGVGYALLVKADSEYQSLSDLKGETLAVTRPGSMSDTGLKIGLEEAGIDPARDVQIIAGGSGASMLSAIESGKVAGGMIAEPIISEMVQSGDYRVLYDPDFDYAGIIVMAKEAWVNENKDAVKTFLRVLTEVNERATANPKAAAEVMQAEFPEFSQEVLEKAITNQLSKVPEGLKVTKAGAEVVTDIAVQLEIIDKPIPYEDAVDLSLLP